VPEKEPRDVFPRGIGGVKGATWQTYGKNMGKYGKHMGTCGKYIWTSQDFSW